MVRFDAYTATLRGPKPDDLMQILFDQVGPSAGFNKTRGFHTFGERMAIKDGGGHEFGVPGRVPVAVVPPARHHPRRPAGGRDLGVDAAGADPFRQLTN